ncbi:helix-turn-helix domain-containing protein [Limosilactobacillus reuteri]|uniref:helix-turn-helix domain-containing protein n=1 Tax=Limosilactobacillus reuteri TaxID=1598 RepID=UPI001E5DF459|nr:helix-turn-helix transcriptional regulator [Limosilactobacillus reuteri]MCC4341638.1 helix-turn-helix transcriptional regulator [Limosilactobacillus reuteri]
MSKNRIRELRKEKGLTLKELSQQLKDKGTPLSASSLIKYERGERQPKLETWIKLADFFKVTVSYLQGEKNNNRLSESLEEKGMSCDEFSELIKEKGYSISPSDIKKYENGTLMPQFETWVLLSALLNVPFNYLVGISENRKELAPAFAPFMKIVKEDNAVEIKIPSSEKEILNRIDSIKKSLPESVAFGYKIFDDVWESIDDMAFKVPKYLKNAVNWYFLEMCLAANYKDQNGKNIDLAMFNNLESEKLENGAVLDIPLEERVIRK